MSRHRRKRKIRQKVKKTAKGLQEALKSFVGMPADDETLRKMGAAASTFLRDRLREQSFASAILPALLPLPPFRGMYHDNVVHLVGDTKPNANGDVWAVRICDGALATGDWTSLPASKASCLACLSREHDTRREG